MYVFEYVFVPVFVLCLYLSSNMYLYLYSNVDLYFVFNDEEEGVLDLNLYSPLEGRHIETVDDA